MPKCSCYSWEKTRYPCKHFFAVMRKFPAWSWDSLSKLYTSNPFLTLDEDIIPLIINEPSSSSRCNISTTLSDLSISAASTPNIGKITENRKSSRNDFNASWFREQLKQLHTLSFLTNTDIVYEEAMPLVQKLVMLLDNAVPKESGIKLEENEKKPIGVKRKFFEIPVRRKKAKFQNRHGVKADTAKKASIINVEEHVSDKSSNILTEVVDLEDEINVSNDIITQVVDLEDEASVSIDDEEIEYVVNPKQSLISIPSSEVDIIKNNEMLTDLSINVAQKLLKHQFKLEEGFQDTILGQKLMFSEESGKFVQILHNGCYHWVMVTNFNCGENEVDYYDSLFHG